MVKQSAPKPCNSFPNEMEMASVANHATEEFLECLRVAACDVSTADMLEIAMLRSWVTAFIRENGLSVHTMMDIVDQEDNLDSPPGELIKGDKPKEERRVIGRRMAKGPEVSEGFSPRKKKSMAELIGVMNAETETMGAIACEKEEKVPVDASLPKKRKERKNRKSLGEEKAVVEEEIASSKRERRKSKYLSPPYTFLSGHSKGLAEGEVEDSEVEAEEIEASKAMPILPTKKEEEETSPLYESANVLLLQFLNAARDPLQLKWNGLSEAIRGFFSEFRNMASSGNPELDAYRKHMKNSVDEIVMYNDKEASLGRRLTVKDEANREARRNIIRDQASKRTPISLGHEIADGAQGKSWRTRKKVKDSVNGEAVEDLDHKLVKSSAEGLQQQKSNTNRGAALPDLSHGLIDSCRFRNVTPRRGKNTEGRAGEILAGFGYTATNGTEDGRFRPKRMKREGNVVRECSSPLPYIRENLETMISTLARPSPKSSEELKPGVRENLVSEMQGLLNKVKNLMAGSPGVS